MSQAPSMPVFTDALIGDTLHLTAEEFGAYCLLLFATWRNNGAALPDDASSLAQICRVTPQRWRTHMRAKLVRFFNVDDGSWHQKRLEKEWAYIQERIEAQREKGRSGARSRWSGTGDTGEGNRRRKDRERTAKSIASHTTAEWLSLLDELGNRCLACGSSDSPLTKDHIKPLAKGGHDGIDNLQPLCFDCNSRKGAAEIDYRTGNATAIAQALPKQWPADSTHTHTHTHKLASKQNSDSLPRGEWLDRAAEIRAAEGLPSVDLAAEFAKFLAEIEGEPTLSRWIGWMRKARAKPPGSGSPDPAGLPDVPWPQRCRAWAKGYRWNPSDGPAPDEPGCWAPADLVAEAIAERRRRAGAAHAAE